HRCFHEYGDAGRLGESPSHSYCRGQYEFIPRVPRNTISRCTGSHWSLPLAFLAWLLLVERSFSQYVRKSPLPMHTHIMVSDLVPLVLFLVRDFGVMARWLSG
ncbi:hypothetical protein CSKR_101900, partial [Clonorchis sinensis]